MMISFKNHLDEVFLKGDYLLVTNTGWCWLRDFGTALAGDHDRHLERYTTRF